MVWGRGRGISGAAAAVNNPTVQLPDLKTQLKIDIKNFLFNFCYFLIDFWKSQIFGF